VRIEIPGKEERCVNGRGEVWNVGEVTLVTTDMVVEINDGEMEGWWGEGEA
jgi:hypothetical protein